MLMFPASFTLLIRVNAPKTRLLGFDEGKGAWRMDVKALPEKGKANAEIIRFFRKEHKLDIRILSGATARKKLIRVLSPAPKPL